MIHKVEASKMTQDRSVNVFGKVQGVVSTGDRANIIQNSLGHPRDVSDEVEEILEQLAVRYTNVSENQKQVVLQMELQQKLKNDPTFKQRFISAAKSGGLELVKVVTNNPFVSVPLETMKGWIEAEP
jgi:hypothetical protein